MRGVVDFDEAAFAHDDAHDQRIVDRMVGEDLGRGTVQLKVAHPDTEPRSVAAGKGGMSRSSGCARGVTRAWLPRYAGGATRVRPPVAVVKESPVSRRLKSWSALSATLVALGVAALPGHALTPGATARASVARVCTTGLVRCLSLVRTD